MGELFAAEALETVPQADVSRMRRLRLHPDEVLEGREDGQRRPAQQELSIQRGTVEGAEAEGLARDGSRHRLMVPRQRRVTRFLELAGDQS